MPYLYIIILKGWLYLLTNDSLANITNQPEAEDLTLKQWQVRSPFCPKDRLHVVGA